MLALKGIGRNINLLNNLKFLFHRKPRDPTLPTEAENMLPYSINYLHDNKGAVRVPKQLGRGAGSGKGKTAGRGHKGQLARQGGHVHVRFEGGQTPISRRLPKYGRVMRRGPIEVLHWVNLERIDYFVKRGIIDPTQTITIKTLVDCGLVKKVKFGVKILGKGVQKIDYPLYFEVTDASSTVINKMKELGGSVKLIHRTPLKLREHMFPQKYPLPLAEPITPWWKVRKLMRKQQNRGVQIQYKKPQWMIDNPPVEKQKTFIYPVPRVSDPEKVRTRKPKLYKKINFGF